MVDPAASDDRRRLFDTWSAQYDAAVRATDGAGDFPFAGYDEVLDCIVATSGAGSGMDVLDVGTGTGNLAARLTTTGCRVWVSDFSRAMLDAARSKLPDAHAFVEADLLAAWPPVLDGPFDRIVSAYVFHEFPDEEKLRILADAAHRLTPDGRIVIGDVAFDDEDARGRARERWRDQWDDDEHYWSAAWAAASASTIGLTVAWTRVSSCAGVFILERAASA